MSMGKRKRDRQPAMWYFKGIDSQRGIAWRTADSFALRDFLGLST